jgi:hypothetical protein
LKNTSTKDNKYVVNQKLEHVDDISFRERFGRISGAFFLQKKILSLPCTMICIYLRWPFQIINLYSIDDKKPGFRVSVALATRGVV